MQLQLHATTTTHKYNKRNNHILLQGRKIARQFRKKQKLNEDKTPLGIGKLRETRGCNKAKQNLVQATDKNKSHQL